MVLILFAHHINWKDRDYKIGRGWKKQECHLPFPKKKTILIDHVHVGTTLEAFTQRDYLRLDFTSLTNGPLELLHKQ